MGLMVISMVLVNWEGSRGSCQSQKGIRQKVQRNRARIEGPELGNGRGPGLITSKPPRSQQPGLSNPHWRGDNYPLAYNYVSKHL